MTQIHPAKPPEGVDRGNTEKNDEELDREHLEDLDRQSAKRGSFRLAEVSNVWGASSYKGGFLVLQDDEIVKLTLKQRMWAFLDDPSSSDGAQIFSLALMMVITFSVVVFCLESLPMFYLDAEDDNSIWAWIETICVIIFTVEYVLRLISCPNKLKFLKSVLNTIDLAAIVPFYLEKYFTVNSAVFRVVRLVRVFRVFKISRYLSWISIFMEAMIQSAQPLTMLLFVMMIGCVFFSSAMFFIEKGEFDEVNEVYMREGKESPFQSIPATFWWCLVTMTTVGYGDVYPITPAGKLVASLASLTGILVLAIPITIISTNFSVEYEKLKKQRKTMRDRVLLLKNHFKERKSGLDAMNMEIEELVKRTSIGFMQEIGDLVEVSKAEMLIELEELVKLAYVSRQKDLRQAQVQADKNAKKPGVAGSLVSFSSKQ
uniref:Ion transport domain-containing protein n=1 Tax=Mucochytrium quahogii TaxID=96639 RepID=A0A7S2S5R2_9STRA|mmetsp:Transcript_25150/g.54303  ORF Transcript_25150/g.54303 Transcript_25150/m.54303 type:complete len:429 (+) Transcript_25150:641-1927(+)